jgi:broad specificity phosphatase PhoE
MQLQPQVQGQPFPDDAEQLGLFWERTAAAWDKLREAAAAGGGSNVVVVGHAAVHAALVCHCLGLGPDGLSLFR